MNDLPWPDNGASHRERGSLPPMRILHWWVVLLCGLLVAGATGLIIAWLWIEAVGGRRL